MRRDLLRRLVEAGRVELVSSYHFDDGYGQSGHKGDPIPCAIMPEDWHNRKEGICYLWPSDFTTSCGSARRGENGNVCLYVHSNCNYDLHIKDDAPEPRRPHEVRGSAASNACFGD